jgi:hypothetical protein
VTGRAVNNVWAPEWFWDGESGSYFVFWSSSFALEGWRESSLWFCSTRDWEMFTPPQVLFAPGYSVIDGTLVEYATVFAARVG